MSQGAAASSLLPGLSVFQSIGSVSGALRWSRCSGLWSSGQSHTPRPELGTVEGAGDGGGGWGRWRDRELGTVEGAIDVCSPLTELPVGGHSARSHFTHHTRHIPPSPLSHTHHHFTRPHLQGTCTCMNSASALISFRKTLSKQSSCQC